MIAFRFSGCHGDLFPAFVLLSFLLLRSDHSQHAVFNIRGRLANLDRRRELESAIKRLRAKFAVADAFSGRLLAFLGVALNQDFIRLRRRG